MLKTWKSGLIIYVRFFWSRCFLLIFFQLKFVHVVFLNFTVFCCHLRCHARAHDPNTQNKYNISKPGRDATRALGNCIARNQNSDSSVMWLVRINCAALNLGNKNAKMSVITCITTHYSSKFLSRRRDARASNSLQLPTPRPRVPWHKNGEKGARRAYLST